MKNDDGLVDRISDALYLCTRGSVVETSFDQLDQDIAWEIQRLRAVGRDAYIKGQREARARLRAMGGFEDHLKEEGDAWLASALLDAAASGRLHKIVVLADAEEGAREPDHYSIIVAYSIVHYREDRPPMIGELLAELGDRRDGNYVKLIRRTLKRFDLPLSRGKRGRPRKAC
jgi:hypothetical protein